jgi:predicted nucleotidyltransferase
LGLKFLEKKNLAQRCKEQKRCLAPYTLPLRTIAFSHVSIYNGSMDPAVKLELEKLKSLIIDAIPVEQIYLFGSHAYGKPQRDSDLDLYIVLKDEVTMRELDAGLQISMAIARKKSMPVDIIVKKKKDFIQRLGGITLERKVSRDGIRIYG